MPRNPFVSTGQHRGSIRRIRWDDSGREIESARDSEAKDAVSRRVLELRAILYEIRRCLETESYDRKQIIKRIDAALGTRERSIWRWLA